MPPRDYKEAKEAFVSQLEGGSVWKINAVSLTALTTYTLWATLRSRRLCFVGASSSSLAKKGTNAGGLGGVFSNEWLLEFAVLIISLILATSVLAQHLLALNAFLGTAAAYVLLRYPSPTLALRKKEAAAPSRNGKHRRHWSQRESSDEEEEDEADERKELLQSSNGAKVASQEDEEDEEPFRVSVDSAADQAHASAFPATSYIPPDEQGRDTKGKNQVIEPFASGLGLHGLSETVVRPADLSQRSTQRRGNGSAGWVSPERRAMGSPLERVRASERVASPQRGSATLSHHAQLSSTSSSSSSLHLPPPMQDAQNEALDPTPPSKKPPTYIPKNQPFLTVYRAHMMLMTVICILAVDFPAFPREFAKCETWGTSLMDLGVGSFVFSLGIVSALPLLRSPRHRFQPMRAQLLRDARKTLPLFLLGAIRVIMVKGVEYPEHVAEYGVYWNFFITLGLLPFFGTLCRPMAKHARFSVMGLFVSVVHQVVLWTTALQSWAISDGPRPDLLTQNKEGITSLPGYFALFLLGLDLGHYVLPRDPYLAYRRPSKSRQRAKTDKLAMVLASFSLLWWGAYGLARLLGFFVSRRLANLAYVLWVTAYNSSFILAYVCIYMIILEPAAKAERQLRESAAAADDEQARSKRGRGNETVAADTGEGRSEDEDEEDSLTPSLLKSLNSHAFAVFLIANLLTGTVNLTLQTMYSSDTVAVIILLLYTGVSLASASVLDVLGWRLKM
ncbi:GWT1-domain-containing protein [Acaromyces ingoldii]|uniref:GPI-anchored wall transfer protein 1 n=1 Tax=Acaromyces ingoldii TaxID=215250 RepID=A0A316YMT3_9BASI|nr:GWT1-domain-containing protein [Acaromyces ingoldii]PWN90677.1 GWT1-domain-containing protein [Acaromyces ingoldii]